MKITVGDVMNNKANVRDYLSVHPENGRIYANLKCEKVVLIDKSNEWNKIKEENSRLRKALQSACDSLGADISDYFSESGELK